MKLTIWDRDRVKNLARMRKERRFLFISMLYVTMYEWNNCYTEYRSLVSYDIHSKNNNELRHTIRELRKKYTEPLFLSISLAELLSLKPKVTNKLRGFH